MPNWITRPELMELLIAGPEDEPRTFLYVAGTLQCVDTHFHEMLADLTDRCGPSFVKRADVNQSKFLMASGDTLRGAPELAVLHTGSFLGQVYDAVVIDPPSVQREYDVRRMLTPSMRMR